MGRCNALFFWPCREARGILVPRPGIEPAPPALEARSLNHWTTREVPVMIFSTFFFGTFPLYHWLLDCKWKSVFWKNSKCIHIFFEADFYLRGDYLLAAFQKCYLLGMTALICTYFYNLPNTNILVCKWLQEKKKVFEMDCTEINRDCNFGVSYLRTVWDSV